MEMDNKLFRFNIPLPSSASLRSIGVYLSGALYAAGFWVFLDAAIFSKTVNASVVHVSFVDWIPAICSSLGMLVVNSIEKSRLLNDVLSPSGSSSSWKARLVLFIGFALLAGGVAGSIVVLILKFLQPRYVFPTLWMGVANVIANGLIMLSCIVLWIAQNVEDEYSYSLAL